MLVQLRDVPSRRLTDPNPELGTEGKGDQALAYVIAEPDYEAVEQLYIDPDECIDCDACVEACPVDACFAEDQLPDEWTKYIEVNSGYYSK